MLPDERPLYMYLYVHSQFCIYFSLTVGQIRKERGKSVKGELFNILLVLPKQNFKRRIFWGKKYLQSSLECSTSVNINSPFQMNFDTFENNLVH